MDTLSIPFYSLIYTSFTYWSTFFGHKSHIQIILIYRNVDEYKKWRSHHRDATVAFWERHEGHGGVSKFTWARSSHTVIDGVKLVISRRPTLLHDDLMTAMLPCFIASNHHHLPPKTWFLCVRRTDHIRQNSVKIKYTDMNIEHIRAGPICKVRPMRASHHHSWRSSQCDSWPLPSQQPTSDDSVVPNVLW